MSILSLSENQICITNYQDLENLESRLNFVIEGCFRRIVSMFESLAE